ncbi:MAG: fructose-1,6-bisphosphatase [Bacilli bacterium]|nr:fructose-1,6-bisphosphatase [Bacilli bacterium]MBN2877454.1 fructose-1,6-bisphosphatase [Bacilli bacterium]
MPYQNKYLELLSLEFPSVQTVSSELINLNAILNLPKGTEIFITDIHGEYDAFNHYLKNASGIIKEKIDLIFPEHSEEEKNRLAFFIYYPTDMLNKYRNLYKDDKVLSILRDQLTHMIELAKHIVTKYTKSKVRKSLPDEFSYIIQELIYESNSHEDKEKYYQAIIDAIFDTKRESKFILELSRFIRRLAVDRLHIVGDIFDRGPSPHLVMEKIISMKNVDIQWGNHDISFLGAACGSEVMIANTIRIAARYNNLDCFEDGYGINLLPLARLAEKYYSNDPCIPFRPKGISARYQKDEDMGFVARIHKAISIIQFKLEYAVIQRNPDFQMNDRILLNKVDFENGTIDIDGVDYPLSDSHFPTINPSDPFALNDDEQEVISHLRLLFLHNEVLQKHARYLIQNGSIYLKYNGNLLFHAAVPLNQDRSFLKTKIDGLFYFGRGLFEIYEKKVRHAYHNRYEKQNPDKDTFLVLWQGGSSPLFGKHTMKTFERYFIADKKTHEEIVNPYYQFREEEKVLKMIYRDFDLDFKKSKIVNGHVPLDITKGDQVVLANKRIYSIDGGMSKEYSDKTNIGGYSLISDSHAYFLVSHERFETYDKLIEQERDIISITRSEELNDRRTYVYDTNIGNEIKAKIDDLNQLLEAYRDGSVKEKYSKS